MTPRLQEFKINVKDITTFKRCRQLWNYSAGSRMSLAPVDKPSSFYLNDAIKFALLRWNSVGMHYNNSLIKFWAQHIGSHDDTVALAKGILDHYQLWQRFDEGQYCDASFEFVAINVDYSVTLWANTRRAVILTGNYDAIVKHAPSNRFFLWNLQSTSRIGEREKQIQYNQTLAIQLLIADEVFKQFNIDAPCRGIFTTLIRKKIPADPRILKDGTLSVDKHQDTSAEWFANFARKHHNTWSQDELFKTYGSLLSHLQANATPYFKRALIQTTPSQLQQTKADLLAVTSEMIDRNTAIYPSENDRCNSCQFRDPCIFHRRGLTLAEDHVIANEYEVI